MEIVLATHNLHKVSEFQMLLEGKCQLIGLDEIGCQEEIPETSETFLENSLQKARWVFHRYGVNAIADDSGLVVESLHGEPGVYSARYAGEEKNDEANNQKLLKKLSGEFHRKAHFKTIIALILNGEEYCFEGRCEGTILDKLRGERGFGYDPLFIPEGYTQTFAEMTIAEKNKISHRSKALSGLIKFLEKKIS